MGVRHRPYSACSCELAGALGGRQEGVPDRGASGLCEGGLALGAHPPPTPRPWRKQSGSTAHMLWVRTCRRGDPALAPLLACPAGLCVPWGWQEVAGGRAPAAIVRSG